MGSALELLTGILILVNSAKDGDDFLLRGKGETVAPLRLADSTIFSAVESMS